MDGSGLKDCGEGEGGGVWNGLMLRGVVVNPFVVVGFCGLDSGLFGRFVGCGLWVVGCGFGLGGGRGGMGIHVMIRW